MRVVKYWEWCADSTKESEVCTWWHLCFFFDCPLAFWNFPLSLFSHLLFPFLSLCFYSVHSPLNLPMKSTLATGNYNEQLHMSASPASEIRRGCVAYTPNCIHKDTHTHTIIHYLISIVTEQPPSAQFCPNLHRKQYWYFTPVHNEKGREERARRRWRIEGRKGKEKRTNAG